MKHVVSGLSLVAVAFLCFTGCKKESFISSPEARLRLSTDSIKFDTVFTTTGSITQQFKIINENNQKLRLDEVSLAGGNSSPFKININGTAASKVTNIEMAANDSIYVFVTITVNPTNNNLPFILSDSIMVKYNGNTRYVMLEAYGQNAVFLNNRTITSNTTWTNNLPYVITGGLRIASTATLIIMPGTKIYAHANAPVFIDGTLKANGTFSQPITFTGDRLDEPYRDFPASWPGLYFRDSSKNNEMIFTRVLNAYDAVVVINPPPNTNPKLTLKQCTIDNAYNTGIFCNNTSLNAENCLVTNCGSNIIIQYGGTYNFTHCTVAAYANRYIPHKTPVLQVSDFFNANGAVLTASLTAVFKNSIFWGADGNNVEDEVVTYKQGNNFSVIFDRCLYKAVHTPAAATILASIPNQDPAFDSIDVNHSYYDFRISKNALAPGINKGTPTSLIIDLDNKNRNVGLPDLGCYEKQ